MKKMLSLALVLALMMMFSFGVMAEDPETGSGWDEPSWKYEEGIFEHHEYITGFFDSALTNDAPANTVNKTITNAKTGYTNSDANFSTGNQAASVVINTQANIPCYIEMVLYGNAGWSKVKSLGNNMEGSVTNNQNGHLMLFAPNFGGFVGEDWNSIDKDVFSSIGAYDGVYLQACDLWTAKLDGNVPHYLNVNATPLTDVNDENPLNIEMRYTLASAPAWNAGTIGAADTSTDIGDFAAFSGEEVTMQFRVPFNAVPAGQYNGTITFKVYSI